VERRIRPRRSRREILSTPGRLLLGLRGRCDSDFVSFPFGEYGSDFKFLTGFIFPISFFHGVDYY
ncbi:hypothetical protein A2U01_0099722, partial [Trifolium medium]|nr:hypothetical protein [Trifolium medium]